MSVALRSVPISNPTEKAVDLRGVKREYEAGGVRTAVLRGIDLKIDPGTVTVIHGSSGSGKTTLLNAFKWCFYGQTDFQIRSRRV